MHIPDGYLSPKTCAFFYASMLPVWYLASRRMESTLKLKELPLLSLGAAFAFVIMMFNVPLPGGTSGHMAGAVVVAIVLGPWASVVALTVVITLQALLFGDGGITTLGANAFNVAFVMSFVGHYVYTLLCGTNSGSNFGVCSKEISVRRRAVAASVAAYLAVNASALSAAFELGLQPALSGSGPLLYAPYSLGVTLPAMMLPHIFFVGLIEAFGTAMVVSYLYGAGVVMPGRGSALRLRPLWFVLAGMILIAPLGLIATAAPWGEWSGEQVTGLIGYLPSGMESLAYSWSALMPEYTVPGTRASLGYILTAAIGSLCAVVMLYGLDRLFRYGKHGRLGRFIWRGER